MLRGQAMHPTIAQRFSALTQMRPRPSNCSALRNLSGRIEARIGLRMMPTVGIEIERAPL